MCLRLLINDQSVPLTMPAEALVDCNSDPQYRVLHVGSPMSAGSSRELMSQDHGERREATGYLQHNDAPSSTVSGRQSTICIGESVGALG